MRATSTERFVVPVAIVEHVGVGVMGERKIRREMNRLPRLGGGLVELLARGEAQREQRMRVGVIRFAGQRLAQFRLGHFVAGLLEEQQRAFEVGVHEIFRYCKISS